MNKNKKTAQICNGEKALLIWRKEEFVYWVSDTYFAKRMLQQDYLEFKTKYSNYTTNPFIPEIEIGGSLEIRNGAVNKPAPDISAVLPNEDTQFVELHYSELNTDDGSGIFYTDKNLVLARREYLKLFDGFLVTEKKPNKPIYVLENNESDEVIGIIMPMRADSYPEIRIELEHINSLL